MYRRLVVLVALGVGLVAGLVSALPALRVYEVRTPTCQPWTSCNPLASQYLHDTGRLDWSRLASLRDLSPLGVALGAFVITLVVLAAWHSLGAQTKAAT